MSKKWWVLASVACGTFMATLDSSIVNIALPTLTKELSVDLHQVKWVVIVYLLVITCLLLPFGRIADQFGRKLIFQSGYFIFTLGSGFCGVSNTLGWLVFSRVVQAVGVAMLMANGPAIITSTFPTKERGAALGILAMVVSAGLLSGPSVGGLLISQFGWRSIFLINIPIGFVGILLVQRFLARERHSKVRLPFDWVGTFLQVLLLLFFIVTFDPPRISISGSIPIHVPRWALALVTLIIGAVFVKVESEVKAPLFDLSLLKIRTFWSANLASFLTFVSFSSVSVLMPFFLEEIMHFTTREAGLFMTAIPFTIFIVAPIAGRLSDTMGSRGLSFAGALIGAIALLGMSGIFGFGIDEHIGQVGIVLALASIGLGAGLFQSPNNNAIMGSVPLDKLGVASALLATVRNLGLVTGTGLATGLFMWRMEVTGDFISSMHFSHLVAGFIAVGAMVASLCKRREKLMGADSSGGTS